MTKGEIFRAAAELIRRNGHWKDDGSEMVPGSKCVWVAVFDVANGDPVRDTLGALMAERATGDSWVGALYAWNDAPERTAEEAIALLDGLAFDEDLKAAATAESTPGISTSPAESPLIKEGVLA